MSFIPVKKGDPLILRLQAISRDNPGLSDAARIYEAVLPVIRDTGIDAVQVSLTDEQAVKKIESGEYLLSNIELDLDLSSLRNIAIKIARAVESAAQEITSSKAGAARQIRSALEDNLLDIKNILPLINGVESGKAFHSSGTADLDYELTGVILKNAFRPVLHSLCSRFSPAAERISWLKGSCFICGAAAALAELQGNDQEMHLRCTSCGADWKFKRLRCMYCDNEDHKMQRFFYSEGISELLRVELCDKCMGYLKVFNSFEPDTHEMLIVKDLETLHLDYKAHELGYYRHACG